MPDVFVARQPIYDRDVRVIGYELLFREGNGDHATVSDADAATSSVLLNAFAEIGLDALVGDRLAFVNVSRRFLLEEYAMPLPTDRVVLELLEDAEVDDALTALIARLASSSYTVALDDFAHHPSLDPLVELAEIVKLDVLAHPGDALEREVDLVGGRATLLAEKVETYDEFERCKALGFELFQGYFFCRPKTVTRRSVPSSRLSTLRLVAQLQAPEVDFPELEAVIARDVGLSYKLLRYINSAFFALPREVDSVRAALVLLGIANVRRWATLLALSGIDDKPEELIVTALVRARMCELLATAYGEPDRDAYFTGRMFSVLDALMDARMEDVLERLPLGGDVRLALLDGEGAVGDVLRCVLSYERGDMDEARHRSLTGVPVGELYLEALAWAMEASGGLTPSAAARS